MKVMDTSKTLQCDDAVKCVFNLNVLDINVYNSLKSLGKARADELADYLNKERSTVYRSLQKLTKCGMCIKKTEKIKKGGYYHIYMCSENKDIRINAERCLDEWYHSIKKTLSQISD